MADNSSSTNSNSWTILSPEVKEPGVESVGPLSEGQGDLQAEHAEPGPEQPEEPETRSGQPHTAEPPQVAPLEGSDEAALLHDFHKKGDPADVETLTPQPSDSGEHGDSGASHESQAHLESDLFSDSYTHVSPSPESTSHDAASSEVAAEERRDLRKTLSEESKPDTDENRSDSDGLRRRKVHLLASLEHRDEEEEEEGEEERFRPPQRDGDIGFSLNKCIIGALVLLGLGTIFFSGMFMDLDDEGDTELQVQKYPEIKKPPEILDQLAKESEQIANLQAQLQQQEVELKTAQQHVEEGTKERLRREELELENQRMRGELNKLPTLQKELEQENERMKKELDGVPVLQKELELLRDKVTELTGTEASAQSGAPSAGGEEEVAPGQDWKEVKDKKARKKEGKKGEKQGHVKVDEKESEKQGAKGKWEKQNTDQDKSQQWKGKAERKDVPKEKQDGGKKGKHYSKNSEEKREFKEGKGKKEWKEDKKWKKEQHEESSGGRREKKGKDDKQGKQKSGESDWKRGKQADQGDKRKDKKNERKERGDWEGEKGNDKGRKEKGYREREEKPRDGERQTRWKKDEKKHKDKHEEKQKRAKEVKSHDLYTDRKHSKVHMHGNYWTEQRERIRHFHGSTKGCGDVTSCARAEGLVPVSRPAFEAFLSGYLKKLQGSEEQATRNEELKKLTGEFFTDGVFVHDQVPFGEFAEDVGDILEDMAGDWELEDEMDSFEREAMERFALQERLGTDEKARQSGRKRSSG